MFYEVLPCPDTLGRRGVSGLRTLWRLVHDESIGNVSFTKIGGRVVQPIYRCYNRRKFHSGWIILPVVHSAVYRRRGALSGGYNGTRNLGEALIVAAAVMGDSA